MKARMVMGITGILLSLALLWSGTAQAQNPLPPSSVWAWGYNLDGQIGDGTQTNRSSAVQVLGPNGLGFLTDVREIACNIAASLAWKNDATVWCWGPFGPNGASYGYPIQVPGQNGIGYLTDIVTIAGGRSHSLAVKSDGTVWAWGSNYFGQLGNGQLGDYYMPVQVVGPNGTGFLTDVVAVAAGSHHSLALKRDGTVWAWGWNDYGELGDGSEINSPTPQQVRGPDGNGYLTNIVAIAGGQCDPRDWEEGGHSLALKSDGTVWAWGRNREGQLSDWTGANHSTPVQVVGPNGIGYLTDVVSIKADRTCSVALKADGTVWAWGWKYFGLGNGSDGSVTPAQVYGSGGSGFLTNIVAIAAGGDFTLALSADGTVWGWGANFYNQLGDGTTSRNRDFPVPVTNLTNAVAISTGYYHSIAIKAEGAVQGRVLFENNMNCGMPTRFEFRPLTGGDSIVRTVNLGQAGTFSFFDIPQGTYHIAIKGSKWLQKVVPNVDTSERGNLVNLRANLLGGDANNDNSVDVFDLYELIQAFDAAPGGYNWNNGAADFNCDGSVDVFDLDILIRNFDAVGDE